MINYIFQFWNSLFGKIVRWLLLIPLQSLLLGAYAMLVITILNLILKFFIFSFTYIFIDFGFWKFILLMLVGTLILWFVDKIINIVIFLSTLLWSAVWFLSIKFSPHKQTGKILLLSISIIVTWITLYGTIIDDSHWFFKTLICLQFLLSFTWLIWNLCLSSDTYDIYNEYWNEWTQKIRKKDVESLTSVSSVSENNNLSLQTGNTWEAIVIETKNTKEYYIVPFWRFILLQILTTNFYLFFWIAKNRKIVYGDAYRSSFLRWHPFGLYGILVSILPKTSFRSIISVVLTAFSVLPFLITLQAIQSDNFQFGIFSIPNVIEPLSQLPFFLWFITVVIIVALLAFFYSPIAITQHYLQKLNDEMSIWRKRLKFSLFEIALYCIAIIIIYVSITGRANDLWTSNHERIKMEQTINWSSYKAKEGTFQVDFPNQNIDFYHSTEKIDDEGGTITGLSYTSDIWESVYGIVEYSTENFAVDGEKIWAFPPVVIEGILGIKPKNQKSENKTTSELEIHRIPGKIAKFEYKQNLIFHDQAYMIKGIVLSTSENKVYNMYVLYPTINSNVETKRFFDSFKIIP